MKHWISYFTTSHKNYSNASFNVVSFFSVLFILVGLFGIYSNISSLKSANSKNQYGITDDVFNEKYYIDTIAEPEVIRNIFTDEICSKIVNEIENMEISFINYSVSEKFGPNIQLSASNCNVHLQKLIRKVKMFDREGCV